MDARERVALLRKLELFDQHSEEKLAALAGHLEPAEFADGARLFEEGAKGDALYFVVSGRVRISKRLPSGGEKDLASVGPGDCLGEMSLLSESPRSASATATGAVSLLKLDREHLKKWLASDAATAMDFFAELVTVMSRRLRRTSAEVTLLYDLSSLLLEAPGSQIALLGRALDRVLPHLPGDWSACAHAYSVYNEEMDPAGTRGPEGFGPEAALVPGKDEPPSRWHAERELVLVLRAPARLLATLRFKAPPELDHEARTEAERALLAAARLLASALENAEFRQDEALRRRLQSRTDAPRF